MALEELQNGRYRVLRPLGSGSMGEVYLVDDTRINRQVAIKVIRAEASPYPNSDATKEATRLFEREAKAIAKLNHPNILPLYDYGEEVVNGAPLTFMVMPFCSEGSLASWLQQRGSTEVLSPQECAHILRQAADALQHAHDNGIIHQDVKPQNFLLRGKSNPGQLPDLLLADFGIAKVAAGTSGASQAIRGTPIYMAPEQWEGHPVPASDQYSLAVMIYQLLTGRSPFQGAPGQMMYQHFNVSPLPPSELNPAVTQEMDTVLLQAMAKRPADRFASISAFANAFQKALITNEPTIANTMQKSKPEDTTGKGIRATLAISKEEARTGTWRTLNLPSGQRVRVNVPAGIQDGQLVQVEGQDTSPGGGGTSAIVPLLLTIAVVPSRENIPNAFGDENRTILSNTPTVHPNTRSGPIGGEPPVVLARNERPTSTAPFNDRTAFNYVSAPPKLPPGSGVPLYIPPERKKTSKVTIALLVGVVLLLLAGSGLLATYYVVGGTNLFPNYGATTTAQANNDTATSLANNNAGTAQANGTSTALAQASGTAQASANATATAQAKATAHANANATATANAQANATATAQANLNATATATAAHAVISNGTGTLQGTFSFDFDHGLQTDIGADVFWDQHDSIVRTMDPKNGTKLANLGVVNFDAITFAQLQSQSYSTNPIDGNNDSSNQLITGDVFAVITSDGNYAKVLIVTYGYDLQIQWVTYHG